MWKSLEQIVPLYNRIREIEVQSMLKWNESIPNYSR